MTDESIHLLHSVLTLSLATVYVILAISVVGLFKLPSKENRNKMALLAAGCAVAFFGATAYTFAVLSFRSVQGDLKPYWYELPVMIFLALHLTAGALMLALSGRYLRVNIYDQKHYDAVTGVTAVDDGEAGDNSVDLR